MIGPSRLGRTLGGPPLIFRAALGLIVPIVLATAIVQAGGMVGLGVVGLAWLYWFIGARWERGLYGALTYVPFAGVVTLAFYPWPAPLLFKDLLFLLPAYAGFFVMLCVRGGLLRGFPRLPVFLIVALGIVVLFQTSNPGVKNILMALIGLKVWLFYIPLFFLSFAAVSSVQELFVLLRLLAAVSLVPSAIGIAESLLVQIGGYKDTMQAIYGEVAAQATQGFSSFDIEDGMLVRIPSTFTFVTQYFGYTLAMLVPCYVLWRGDPSGWWRRVGGWGLGIVAIASFLSGARAAFVFVPVLLALTFGLHKGFSGLVRSGAYTVGVLGGALAILHVGGWKLYDHISELVINYGGDIAYGGLIQAITAAPLGNGTGTNTGPARYAFSDPRSFTAIENYYAKAAYELGLPGLLLVVGLFCSLVFLGYRIHRRLVNPSLRCCSAGLLAFLVVVALNSTKGWLIDVDPVNVYFWVFAGLLLKLPSIDAMVNPPVGAVREVATRADFSR